MKTIPKELTPELLLLIFGGHSTMHLFDKNRQLSIIGNILYIPKTYGSTEFNIDTLTRLLKEWCFMQGYKVSSYQEDMSENRIAYQVSLNYGYINESQLGSDFDTKLFYDTEFEAVLRATEWVVKEKGLI